jgi:hypothetical protein
MATLRQPSTAPPTETPSATIQAPLLSDFLGTWSVTHSSLPMWRKSRNVRITYTALPNKTPVCLDDEVSYQKLGSKSISTVKGVDKPFLSDDAATEGTDGQRASLGYNWRGKGWLMIATSKWEVLGYGDEEGSGNKWVVTYFAKTLFTPAGVDFYSRSGPLQPGTVEGIKEGLKGLGGDVAKLAEQVFEVAMDGDRD